MQNVQIFWPVMVMILTTMILYWIMMKGRIAAIKAGSAKVGDFKIVGNEPPESAARVRAIANQYETPVLFYVVCMVAFMTAHADLTMIVLAWAYAASKVAHIAILVTSNRVKFRRPMFMVAFLVLFAMWVRLALALGGII